MARLDAAARSTRSRARSADDHAHLRAARRRGPRRRRRQGRGRDRSTKRSAAGLAVEIVRTGSRGLFWLEPMVEVETPAGRIAFGPVTAADVPGLFADGLPRARSPSAVRRPAGGDSLPQAPDAHHLRALRHHRSAVARRLSRPWRLARPASAPGASVPAGTVEEVTKSGLRGRGGAGFPTGIKWKTVADTPADRKYIVCNADEGDSRHLRRPHDHGRRSLPADRGHDDRGLRGRRDQGLHLYPFGISRRHPRHGARHRAGRAPTACWAAAAGFDIEVRVGAGAYVCGEETSLLESLEGKRGQVRAKPPLPAHKGLFGKPTVINNLISLATVPVDPGRWRQALRRSRHGPLARHHADPARRQHQAWRPVRGAPSASPWARSSRISAAARRAAGRCAPCRSAVRSAPISRARCSTRRSTTRPSPPRDGLIGHGGVVVFDDTVDMAHQARFALEFCAIESCGKCTPCRIGSMRGTETMDKIIRGERAAANLALIDRPLPDAEVRLALRAGRLHALSGDERDQAFPRGFRLARASRRRRNERSSAMSLVHETDYGTPRQPVRPKMVTPDDRRPRGHGAGRHLDHARGHGCRHPGAQALRHRFGRSLRLLPALPGRDRGPRAARPPPAPRRSRRGMVVSTQTERLKQVRKGVMELYISDHPLDCLTCAANGDCELQDMAGAVGLRDVRYGYDGREPHSGRRRTSPTRTSPSTRPSASSARAACAPARRCRAPSRSPSRAAASTPRSSAGMDERFPRLRVRVLRRLRAGLPDRDAVGEERHRDRPARAFGGHDLRLLRRRLQLQGRDARRGARAHGALQGRQGQSRPFLRQGPLRLGLRQPPRAHPEADDPRDASTSRGAR